jgi:hypothetical protein
MLPNGMAGSMFVASLRQNDNALVNMSGLNNYLVGLLEHHRLANGAFPSLYGDGIFARLPTIMPRFRNVSTIERLRFINLGMSTLRETVEHLFGFHFNLFKALHDFLRLRLLSTGQQSVQLVIVSFFVWNCYQTIYKSSMFFNLRPPTLEDYLPVNEDFRPLLAPVLARLVLLFCHVERRSTC